MRSTRALAAAAYEREVTHEVRHHRAVAKRRDPEALSGRDWCAAAQIVVMDSGPRAHGASQTRVNALVGASPMTAERYAFAFAFAPTRSASALNFAS